MASTGTSGIVLDLSNNDLSTLDPAGFKAAGVTGVILGVFSRGDAPNQMRKAAQACRDAGLTIHGFYGLIYFGDDYGEVRDTHWAIQLAQEFGVRRVWLDCETDANLNGWTAAPTPTPEQRVAAIGRCVTLVRSAGLSPGIYTGGWWWPSGTGSSTAFARLPLWNSYYDQDPDVDGLPYGGWETAAVEQYSSTTYIAGRNRDVNRIYETEEDALKLTEAQTENLLLRLFAGKEFVSTESREQRLERALAELDKTETVQSVSDTALSAIVLAQTCGAGTGPIPAGTTFTATVQ